MQVKRWKYMLQTSENYNNIQEPTNKQNFGESGLVTRIGRFLIQTPLDIWPGLGTQPRYKVLGDLLVENVQTQ